MERDQGQDLVDVLEGVRIQLRNIGLALNSIDYTLQNGNISVGVTKQ